MIQAGDHAPWTEWQEELLRLSIYTAQLSALSCIKIGPDHVARRKSSAFDQDHLTSSG